MAEMRPAAVPPGSRQVRTTDGREVEDGLVSAFRWHRELNRLDIPAQRVLRLERSLSDVQVALPETPAQEATAYICAFAAGQGVRVSVALHLHRSDRLAFYLHADGEVPRNQATRIYNQALAFAESMGFMMGDLDIHLMSPAERIALWKSVPLPGGLSQKGVAARQPPAGSAATPTGKAKDDERGGHPPGPRSVRSAADPRQRRREMLEGLGRFLASF